MIIIYAKSTIGVQSGFYLYIQILKNISWTNITLPFEAFLLVKNITNMKVIISASLLYLPNFHYRFSHLVLPFFQFKVRGNFKIIIDNRLMVNELSFSSVEIRKFFTWRAWLNDTNIFQVPIPSYRFRTHSYIRYTVYWASSEMWSTKIKASTFILLNC